ncbi:MAG: glutamine synthetase [Clostridiales bacterium]|nr:glutamine synthetase [Clostridiales bacterium]
MNKLYYVDPQKNTLDEIKEIIMQNPLIQFISLQSVDLGNHHTDEKIPINSIIDDFKSFIRSGIQTDGSSVVLPYIADINNAKVDMVPDTTVKWIVDYNYLNLHQETKEPIGTLVIPAFLVHDNKNVCSRSILKKACEVLDTKIKSYFEQKPEFFKELELTSPIKQVNLTLATEVEFWVKSPDNRADEEKLSTSQSLKEQYWQRTIGSVRAALEESLMILERFGLEPEMGHKEVGGIASKLKSSNYFTHIMEQIEVDWKFDLALQSADNEIFAKDIITDIFTKHGLVVTFKAKPIEGVAGSGEHHHVGIALKLEDGKLVNLFSPLKMDSDFINRFGYAALMGILNNYSLINPFATSSNDGFNRLKPGFEAPVCTVCSLGHSPDVPSRNRTVLLGLVRDIENPYATRFELRSPNPSTNTYLTVSAIVQAMIDGFEATIVNKDMTAKELLAELNKSTNESAVYLKQEREFRSEKDVFEAYSDDERDQLYGKPPKTVWENIQQYENTENKSLLIKDGIFSDAIVKSYLSGIESQWLTELKERIISRNIEILREMISLHENDSMNEIDKLKWNEILDKKLCLMKDTFARKSLFTQLNEAITEKDYPKVSDLQIKMADEMVTIKEMYRIYRKNIVNL